MIDKARIENELYGWIVKIDPRCIIANPNAPRPLDALYSTLHIIGTFPQGVAETRGIYKANDQSIDMKYSDVEEVMVSINTFYSGAFLLATSIKDSFIKLAAYDYFTTNNLLGYLRSSDVRDLTTGIDKHWEDRAQFDCFFATRSLEMENIEVIRKVELTNKLDGVTTIITQK